MRKMLNVFFSVSIFFLLIFFPLTKFSFAQSPSLSQKEEIIVFVRNGCQHCKNEEEFLNKFIDTTSDVSLKFYRLENPDDHKIWETFTTRYGISKVTPITVIGDTYIIGFENESSTGRDIENLVKNTKDLGIQTDIENKNLHEAAAGSLTCPEDGSIPCKLDTTKTPYLINLPFLGKIDANKYPLIILAAMLGFFDGFNPCAMWVLVSFLVILMQVGNRRKMLAFAGTFILAEAIMYSLILTVWYKTWDFVKLDTIITPVVGIVSLIGGIFFIKEWRKKELECKVTNLEDRSKTHKKITDLASREFTLFTFLGILGVAFSVNVIEFACSIGIPQAFTKIMDLNHLSFLHGMLLITIYILFYMIDDLVVFGIALYGIDRLSLATKYSKTSNLLGGIVMIILGLIMLIRPGILLF